jgi:hypothetical protein
LQERDGLTKRTKRATRTALFWEEHGFITIPVEK